MLVNFSGNKMISYDVEKSSENLSEKFTGILDALISFPLNIPGTAHHKCVTVNIYVYELLLILAV